VASERFRPTGVPEGATGFQPSQPKRLLASAKPGLRSGAAGLRRSRLPVGLHLPRYAVIPSPKHIDNIGYDAVLLSRNGSGYSAKPATRHRYCGGGGICLPGCNQLLCLRGIECEPRAQRAPPATQSLRASRRGWACIKPSGRPLLFDVAGRGDFLGNHPACSFVRDWLSGPHTQWR